MDLGQIPSQLEDAHDGRVHDESAVLKAAALRVVGNGSSAVPLVHHAALRVVGNGSSAVTLVDHALPKQEPTCPIVTRNAVERALESAVENENSLEQREGAPTSVEGEVSLMVMLGVEDADGPDAHYEPHVHCQQGASMNGVHGAL